MSGMTQWWRRYGLKIALQSSVIVCGVIAYAADCALAQLIPDGTLANNSSVTPLGNTSIIINGAGGSLSVTASESVQLIGTTADGQSPSALSTQTQRTGSAGELRINTAQLLVTDGAQVTLSSVGSGEAGNLEVADPSISTAPALEISGTITYDTSLLVVIPGAPYYIPRNGGDILNSPSGKASIPDVPKPDVPEPSSTLGILAFAAFSVAKMLKRKQKIAKSAP